MPRTHMPLFRCLIVAVAALVLAGSAALPAQARGGGGDPDKPRGLSAEASFDRVVLSWDDPGDDTIDGYVILRRTRGVDARGVFTELVADTGSAAAGYTDLAVAAGTPYTYRVKAVNEHGTSERSRWVHIDTPPAPVPDKPAGLSAVASFDRVALSWDDPGDGTVTGYVILRRIRGVDARGVFSVLVADTGSAAAGYSDLAVAAGTLYTYRIKAVNEHGTSERSRWVHIDTPAAPEAVAAGPGGAGQGGGDDAVGVAGRGASGVVGTKANVSEPVGTDFPGTTSTTGEVDVGGRVTGNIDRAANCQMPDDNECDYFKVEFVDGTRYQFDLEGADTGRGTLGDPYLQLQRDDNVPLAGTQNNNGGVGRNARVVYAPTSAVPNDPDATLYIAADAAGGTTGTYTLSVIVLGPDGNSEADVDFPADSGTAGRVEVGASATGTIGSDGDKDWFAVDLEAGTAYQVDLEGTRTDRGTLDDLFLTFLDGSGSEIAADDDSGEGLSSRLVLMPAATGTYYAEAKEQGGGFGAGTTGTYTLSVAEVETRAAEGGTDFAANAATLGMVEVGGSATGTVDMNGDVDWFRVVLEAGTTYVFDLEGAATGAGTLPDPALVLSDPLNPGGPGVASDDDGGVGVNSRLEYTATANGVHYLRVYTDAVTASDVGTYRLSVREGTILGVVEVGGSATGDIGSGGERDSFVVDLEADTVYEIAVRGFFTDHEPGVFNLPSRVPNYGYGSARYSLHAPWVVVRDSDGVPVAAGRSAWVWSSLDPCRPLFFERRDPVVSFTPAETGSYTISVGSGGAGSYWKRSAPNSNGDCTTTRVEFDATGTYEMSVREWPPHIAEPVRASSEPSHWFWDPHDDRDPISLAQFQEEDEHGDSSTADTYGRGETIEYEVAFTEAVAVTGIPELYLRGTSGFAGRGDRWARYDRGAGTDTLVFAYTVEGGDYDERGYKTGAWLGGGKRLHFRLRGDAAITSVATGSHAVLESYHGSSHSSLAGQKVNGSVTTP